MLIFFYLLVAVVVHFVFDWEYLGLHLDDLLAGALLMAAFWAYWERRRKKVEKRRLEKNQKKK